MTTDEERNDALKQIIFDLADEMVPFLMPYLRPRGNAAMALEFVPRSPDHLTFARRRGFLHPERCIMAFLAADADIPKLCVEFDALIVAHGAEHVFHATDGSVSLCDDEEVFEVLMEETAFSISVAWFYQLAYAMYARAEPGLVGLSPGLIDDAMLPPERDVFETMLARGGFDVATSVAVLKDARAALERGRVLPDRVAREFLYAPLRSSSTTLS